MKIDTSKIILHKIEEINMYRIKCPKCGYKNSLKNFTHICPDCGTNLVCANFTKIEE